jgi:hypothetical protein
MFSRYAFFNKFVMKLLIPFLIFATAQVTAAGELGHYMPGVASIRDFIVPEPGFYYEQYNLLYTTDTYNDRNGDEVKSIGPVTLDANVDSFAIAPTFIWSSSWKIFGASYAAYIQPSIVNTSVQAGLSATTELGVNIDESQWGFGDLYIKPIWLGWNRPHTALSLGYGVYAPTGDYSDGEPDNTGLGFWTHEFQAGLTVFPWVHQGTAIMLTGTYEIHHEKDGADITPGDRFSLDYGVSQYIPVSKAETMLLELGLSGYSQWQVDDDSGDDVIQVLKIKDEVQALGGQIGLTYVPWNAAFTFRYMKEYDAEARFEGSMYTLMFVKGF